MKITRLASRLWRFKRAHFVRSVLGISIGASGLLAVSSTNDAIQETFEDLTHGFVGNIDVVAKPRNVNQTISEDTLSDLQGIHGVEWADPELGLFGAFEASNEKPQEAMVFGKQLQEGGEVLGIEVAQGRVFQPRHGEVMLTETLADRLQVTLGDEVRLTHKDKSTRLEVVGLIQPVQHGRIWGGAVAFVPLRLAQDLTQLGTSSYGASIYLKQGMNPRRWIADVSETTTELLLQVPKARLPEPIRQFQQVLTLFSVMTLLLGVTLILGTLNIGVTEQSRRLALLRLLGARTSQVRQIVHLQGLVHSVFATPIAIVGGILVSRLTIAVVSRLFNFLQPADRVSIEWDSIALAIAVCAVLPQLTSLVTSRRASKIDAIRLFRSKDPAANEYRVAFLGLTLLGAGTAIGLRPTLAFTEVIWIVVPLILLGASLVTPLLLIPLTFLLRLRRGPSSRLFGLSTQCLVTGGSRSRTSLALLTVVLTFTVGTLYTRDSMKSLLESVANASLQADLNVYVIGASPSLSLEEEIKAIEGVRATTSISLRQVGVRFGSGDPLQGLGMAIVDPATFFEVFQPELNDKTLAQARRSLEVGAVLVREDLVPSGNASGDLIQLEDSKGVAAGYGIGGILRMTPTPIALIVGRESARNHMEVNSPDVISLRLSGDATSSMVKNAIKSKFGMHRFQFVTAAEKVDSSRRILDDYGLALAAVAAIGLAAAFLGLVNSIEVSILHRLPQLRLMAVLGATTHQVRHIIRLETVLMTLLSTVAAVPAGAVLSKFTLNSLSEEQPISQYVDVWKLLLVPAIAVACSILAARPALRRMSQIRTTLSGGATDETKNRL